MEEKENQSPQDEELDQEAADQEEARKKYQEYLQKSFEDMSAEEKNALAKDMARILTREPIDKMITNFRKIEKLFSKDRAGLQREFNRLAKKYE